MNTNDTMSIAVLSGKGGVGKTNLALNIARTMYKDNAPSLLLDCDLGLANIDVILGLNVNHTLHDVMMDQVDTRDAIVAIEENGFDFLPAATGLPELSEMDTESLALLFSRLEPYLTPYKYLFMDLGAGISPTVLSFASIAHMNIIVITPEPTSITDGYAVIKILKAQYNITEFNILINQVTSKQEYELASKRICEATMHFLGIKPNVLGFVQQDKAVQEAVLKQTPFTKYAPSSAAARNVQAIAAQIKRIRQNKQHQIKKGAILSNL